MPCDMRKLMKRCFRIAVNRAGQELLTVASATVPTPIVSAIVASLQSISIE